jgi:hypothetical protein
MSPLIPTLAVSHGVCPHALPPNGVHWLTQLGNYCGAEIGQHSRRIASKRARSKFAFGAACHGWA